MKGGGEDTKDTKENETEYSYNIMMENIHELW